MANKEWKEYALRQVTSALDELVDPDETSMEEEKDLLEEVLTDLRSRIDCIKSDIKTRDE